MAGLTYPIAPDGLRVPAIIWLSTVEAQNQQTSGQSLPIPVQAQALIDSGTVMTAVVPRVLTQLGATPSGAGKTQTAGGVASIRFYQISLTVYDPTGLNSDTLHRDTWTVTDLPHDLSDVDLLIGMDLIRQLVLTVNGPANQFTLTF